MLISLIRILFFFFVGYILYSLIAFALRSLAGLGRENAARRREMEERLRGERRAGNEGGQRNSRERGQTIELDRDQYKVE